MTTGLDRDELTRCALTVWQYKMGEQVALLIHLGDRLGLYRAMAGAGPLSSDEVAGLTGLHERLVREWLLGQAAADLLARHDDGRFELTPVQAALLADEDDSIHAAVGAFRGGTHPDHVDALVESFRTGVGVTYEQQGGAAAAGLARTTAPWSRLALASIILPALNGVTAKLADGATVVDIGCGAGVSAITIAQHHPRSYCIGYDPSPTAIELARKRAVEAGVSNVAFEVAPAEDLPADTGADLVLCFDCLHDMPSPDRAVAAIRQAMAEDGTLLVKEIRSSGSFERDSRNPLLAMLYGFSVTSCLQSALSEPGGAGLGTLGLHPEALGELVGQAGFSSIVQHDFDDPGNLYYEIRA